MITPVSYGVFSEDFRCYNYDGLHQSRSRGKTTHLGVIFIWFPIFEGI